MATGAVRLQRTAPLGDAQPDFFVPDISDIPVKDDQELMTLPLLFVGDYRGRQKPVCEVVHNTSRGKVQVQSPEGVGIATIRDYDLLLFAISVIIDELNRGEEFKGRTFTCHAYTFLKFARRTDSSASYNELAKALERLKKTTITTKAISEERLEGVSAFSWLDDYKFIRDEKTGKISELQFTIPRWVQKAAMKHKNVLTLNKDYFLLVPKARWLYRIMRKSAGINPQGWRYSLREMHRMSGSLMDYRQWKHHTIKLLRTGPLLDYFSDVKTDDKDDYLYYIHADKLADLNGLGTDKAWDGSEIRHPWQLEWLSEDQKQMVIVNRRQTGRLDDVAKALGITKRG